MAVPRILPIVQRKVKVVETGGGGVPEGAAVMTDGFGPMDVIVPDTLDEQSDDISFLIEALYEETLAEQTDAISLTIREYVDENAPLTDAGTLTYRVWATFSADNDSSQTNPNNANGQPNGTLAVCKTNNAIGDLTNPVIVHSSDIGTNEPGSPPAGLLNKRARVFFSATGVTPWVDTAVLRYNPNAFSGGTIWWTHLAGTSVNYLSSGLSVNLNSLSWSDYIQVAIIAEYTAAVIATPQSAINIDAWCLEYDVQF